MPTCTTRATSTGSASDILHQLCRSLPHRQVYSLMACDHFSDNVDHEWYGLVLNRIPCRSDRNGSFLRFSRETCHSASGLSTP